MQKQFLRVVAAIFLSGCTSSANHPSESPKVVAAPDREVKEKIIVVPPIKDTSSIYGHLHPLKPYRVNFPGLPAAFPDTLRAQLVKGSMSIEYASDTTKIHIKGDSCWLEYVSVGQIRIRKKAGGIMEGVYFVQETTDKKKF